MKRILLSAALLLTACGAEPADEYATENGGPVGMACRTNADCETPMDYLIRSSCPFASVCLQGTCAVVCPMMDEQPNPDTGLNEKVACSTDSDCDCSAYAAEDMIRCVCAEGSCMAVVAE